MYYVNVKKRDVLSSNVPFTHTVGTGYRNEVGAA